MSSLYSDQTATAQEEKRMSIQFLTFSLSNQLYGIPIEQVTQIIGVLKVVPMPEYPDYVKGIVNLRGDIVPVIDIRLRFHMEEAVYTEKTCIIICNLSGMHVGFIVDAVDEVVTIRVEDILPAPDLVGESSRRFVTGVGKPQNKIILLLSSERIIQTDELEKLKKE